MYNYVCPICKKNINNKDLCVLKHIRHGEVLGECVGHFNVKTGTIFETDKYTGFRGIQNNNGNSHLDIFTSEVTIEKINWLDDVRKINGLPYNFQDFLMEKKYQLRFSPTTLTYSEENINLLKKEFATFPLMIDADFSGLKVQHKNCSNDL